MTLYQFMSAHPILTVILGYFAMCAVIGFGYAIGAGRKEES